MLERETERLVGIIGQRSIGASPSVALKDILASDIPQTVKSFFRADVEAMLLEEHRAAVKNTRFNYDHPDVRSAQSQLHSAMVLHFTFSREEYLERLGDAIHLLTNYLVRPQWTLNGVVFEREQAISVEALKRLLLYFAPYDYLRDVLLRYSEDRKVAAFTREEFSALLEKIDAAYVRRKSGLELANTLLPLYEFFDFPRNTGRNAMPLRALIRFFEDKGLTDVQMRLEGELAQGLQELPAASLGEMLEEVRQNAGGFNVDRTERKAAEPADGEVGVQAGRAEPPAREEPVSASTQRKPVSDIASAIADHEKRKFVRRIFRHEEEQFTAALDALSRMGGWKEASRHIDEIFISNDVDPYSAEAERFTQIVFNQFHPPR